MEKMLLPRPQSLRETAESFELVPETVICCANAAAVQPAELLAEYLRTPTGFALEVKQTAAVPGGIWLPLEKVYQFTPCPDGLTPEEEKFILGGQAQLWSEYIPTPEHQEYMAFPRACALAEKLWTKEEFCRLLDFKQRLNGHRSRLDVQNVAACPLP